jgi:hypothetical protein
MGWNYKRIPVIGKELAKIGHIYDMATLPCTPTPEIWVLAFWYGIPRLLWSLYKPDPLDETWSRVGRTRGIKRRQRLTFTEEYTADIPLKPALYWVRWAGDWAQRVGWWMLIVDAAIDHAMYWQSAAMAFEGCKTEGAAYAQASTDDTTSEITGGGWKRVFLAVTDTHIFSGGIGEVHIPPGYGYYASFDVAAIPDPGQPPEARSSLGGIRVIDGDGNTVMEHDAVNSILDDSARASGFVKKPLIRLSDNQLQFQVKSNGTGWMKITHTSITVTGSGIPFGLKQGDP